MRDLLIEALAVDRDRDGFAFQVSPPTALSADAAGRGGWRFSVESRLAGTTFATVRVDVVARGEEITATERLPLPNPLAFAGTPPAWAETYRLSAGELTETPPTLAAATDLVRRF